MIHSYAKILKDSVDIHGQRLTTFETYYPLFIHAEMLRHRAFSSSVASARAIPFKTQIEQTEKYLFLPTDVRHNEKGMQGYTTLTSDEIEKLHITLNELFKHTVNVVQELNVMNIHKQTINRYLAPFQYVKHVITATDYDNFFKLRLAVNAQPEIQHIATLMNEAMNNSIPTLCNRGTYHFPYITEDERDKYDNKTLLCISVARLARTSYDKAEVDVPVEKYKELHDRLLNDNHMSPFEHVAICTAKKATNYVIDTEYHVVNRFYNFNGWMSQRFIYDNWERFGS